MHVYKSIISLFYLLYNCLLSATISGTVTDLETGKPIIGAQIILVDTNTGTYSDVSGNYVIDSVAVGEYTIKVSSLLLCTVFDSISIDNTNDRYVYNFNLTYPKFPITTPLNLQKYHESIAEYDSPIVIKINEVYTLSNKIYADFEVTNLVSTNIYLTRILPCFSKFYIDLFNPFGQKISSNIIDLSCDVYPLRLPTKKDIIVIEPNRTTAFPNKIIGKYATDHLQKGKYYIQLRYEYQVYEFLGPVYIGCNSIKEDYEEEIEVLTTILRGRFTSDKKQIVIN